MTDEGRRAYLRFATIFVAIGGVFLGLGIVRAVFLPDVLRGDPTPVALLLLAIGFGLRWTVARAGPPPEAPGPQDGEEEAEGATPAASSGAAGRGRHGGACEGDRR